MMQITSSVDAAKLIARLAYYKEDWRRRAADVSAIDEAMGTLAAQASQIEAIREIIELWFSPWGAAKGEAWEYLSNDRPFDPNVALELIRDALKN